MTARRRYDPDHCTACGDFLPCGESWVTPPAAPVPPVLDVREVSAIASPPRTAVAPMTELACTCRPLGGQHVTGCPCRVPCHAPAVSLLDEARSILAANQRLVILDVIAEHRRVRNVRSCSAKGCDWRPAHPGSTSDPEATLRRHAAFNEHLASVIVERMAQL